MGKFLKRFDTHSQYESYTANTDTFILPNVSICDDQPTVVHYNPWIERRIVAKFNVTDTSNPTVIINSDDWVSAIEIDGVEQPSVITAYTFDSLGTHTVKYTLADQTSIGTNAFRNCLAVTKVIIPDNVETIGNRAFMSCDNLTAVTIGNMVTEIGAYAFFRCSSLTSISIPDSVETIGDYAFSRCDNPLSATIGRGVTSIGSSAFDSCYSLASITVKATMPPTLGSLVFRNTNNCPIYVPSVAQYVAANDWRIYHNRLVQSLS